MTATNALTAMNGTNGYQQHIEIDPTQPLSLTVTNASGQVRVSSSDQSGVWVVVRRTDGEPSEDPEDIPISVNVDGNSISIHPDWAQAGGLGAIAKKIKDQLQHGFNASEWNFSNLKLHPDLNYDIRVEIPRTLAEGSKVVARTASGATSVTDIDANVTVATASGAAELRKITGATSVHSASGSIKVEKAVGSLEANAVSGAISVSGGEAWTALRTVSGAISVDDFTMKNARIASVSGSVRANFVADNSQEYSFETVSGSVRFEVVLPSDVRSTLTFRSLSGSANAGGDWIHRSRKAWSAGDGEQGPQISVKTVSGSLKSNARTETKIAARHEALPATVPAAGFESSPDATDMDDAIEREIEQRVNDQSIDRQIEAGVESAMGWVRDFTKSFTGPRETPPPPPPGAHGAHPAPPPGPHAGPPAPPPPPLGAHGADPVAPPTGAAAAGPGQSWTWSSSSGTPPPSGQATEPIDPAPVVEQDGADDTTRLTVLEALERGEIDVEEALARLDREEKPAR